MRQPYFLKGKSDFLISETSPTEAVKKIQEAFNKILDGKNLSFLLGSGCSSYIVKEESDDDPPQVSYNEIGIPTMLRLAEEYFSNNLSEDNKKWLSENIELDTENEKFSKNIEFFLGVLHSYKFVLDNVDDSDGVTAKRDKINKIISESKNYLTKKILNEENVENDRPLQQLYEKFYRKLLYRNLNLPKANIFTTNYDLYTETALDRLGIHYVNGFSGGIHKYFNPTIFNYALSEKMDLSQSKWNVIDNFFYLYKIHGSVNWISDEESSKLFRIREIQDISYENLKDKENIMIHPTPLKHNASFGSPYSDLFREFQKKLMRNNNILITLGYSFSDEHINNLIYQAFTIPSFRLIILGDPEKSSEINTLKNLDDPRIWIIGGETEKGDKLHYFKGFVENILPDMTNDEIDDTIERAIKTLINKGNE